jgi:hypothetical protein
MISTMACVIGGFILIWKLSKDVIATHNLIHHLVFIYNICGLSYDWYIGEFSTIHSPTIAPLF